MNDKIYVLMPVHNRVESTRCMIECLQAQTLRGSMCIIVVDDGSTDGTAEYLSSCDNLIVLKGGGSLWWGGSIDLAMRYAMSRALPADWVLLVNNDIEIRNNFVQSLLETALRNPKSAIGSVVRDRNNGKLLSVGPIIDAKRMIIKDWVEIIKNLSPEIRVCKVDALSGRGVLFPVAGLVAAGGMRPGFLPHYFADYELSLRIKSSGWSLIVDLETAVFSENNFGSDVKLVFGVKKYLTIGSPSYLPAQVIFWWKASSIWQRFTLPFRGLKFMISSRLRIS